MAGRYEVKSIDMGNGEWMPLLVDTQTGIGVFEATAYALTLRSNSRRANTLKQALSAVAFLYETLAEANVDLMARVRGDDLLTLGEVEALVARCKFVKSELLAADKEASGGTVTPVRKTLSKNRAAHYGVSAVQSGTAATRLYYIAGYLEWLAEYAFLSEIPKHRKEFLGVATLVVSAIRARIPESPSTKGKKGITKAQEERLLAVTHPDSPENPWRSDFLRKRNFVIVRLLRDLGIRKGELLGVKIEDIDFGDNTVFIVGRPDDPEDPRPRQPQVKTLDRKIPMGDDLAILMKHHLSDRYQVGNARKHPFLIVSDEGEPLALNSVDYLFTSLREKFPELAPLSAHLLRHTWNDAFSVLAKATMKKEEARKIRNYLMGWSDTSTMEANYTVRFVEEEGRAASLKMQNAMYVEVNQ